jgi:hypothetical protein
MNPQEYEALRSLLAQLVEIRGVNKDPEADLLIREAAVRQPDATYLLVQRTLLLSAALDAARGKMAALERAQRQTTTSEPPWGFGSPPEAVATAEELARRRSFEPPLARPPSTTATVSSVPLGSGATPSFLGQAAAAAAGVAGGAFLFQGVEDLLGHHGGVLSTHDAAVPSEDVTVNNYYGSEPEDEREAGFDRENDGDPFADAGGDFV